MPALLIALAVVAGVQSGVAVAQDEEPLDLSKYDAFLEPRVSESKPCSGASDRDRLRLCNACRPMGLTVEGLSKDARAIGLTEDRLRVTAESRLRAARLYTASRSDSNWADLYVRVTVTGPAVSVHVGYDKLVTDSVSGVEGPAETWRTGSTGIHGRDSGFIVQNVSEKLDKFLVEYLRVNEEHCPR